MKILKNKTMPILVLAVALMLVISSCSGAGTEPEMKDEKVAEAMDQDESMDKEDTIESDDSMEKVDEMGEEETMDKEEGMNTEDAMDDESSHVPMMTNDGKRAPEFEFLNSDGETVTLAGFEGKKVYVKYWASWCSICLAGLEELDSFFAEDNDFELITVVMPGEYGEMKQADFVEWFDGLGYENIKVYFDEGATIGNELGIRAFPTSVFIGSDGVLISVAPGHKSSDQIKEKIESFY